MVNKFQSDTIILKYFLIAALLFMVSCKNQDKSFLELTVTSRNKDTFVELKAFYLTSHTDSIKSVSYKNINCVAPNKFVFKNLEVGTYIGLIDIDNGTRYYIDLGSIYIGKRENKISREINLGTFKL